jgi:hypothetical protein
VTVWRIAFVAALAAIAVAAVPSGSLAAKECDGIQRCVPVEGPWVAVASTGETEFMLQCPHNRGIVAGTDGLASSVDIHATFDGILGSPIAYGRTTNSSVLFRAVSGRHHPGSFRPFVGCIPSPSSVRNTIAAKASPVGPPLDLRSRLVKLNPGLSTTVSLSCGAGESLVDSWSAKAFASVKPPAPELAAAIELKTKISGRQAVLLISTGEGLPAGAAAEVQLGVRCAQ